MGLLCQTSTWGHIAQRENLFLIDPGAEGHGWVHQRGTQTRFHQTLYFPCHFEFLLCGQEGQMLEAGHWLSYSQQSNHQIPVPSSPGPICFRTTEGSSNLHLDLCNTHNIIWIRKGDEWKTAFVTPSGHYEYRVMPYRLSNSSSVFQGFMNEVFWDVLHCFVIIYIDDILIYSRNLADHRHHDTQVLQQFIDYQHYLKIEKCKLHTHPCTS